MGADAFEEITDPGKMVRLFQKALEEEEKLEVTINKRPRIYYSHLMDHPPEAANGEGREAPEERIAYVPHAYLKEKQHLLLSPLKPAGGNTKVAKSKRVTIRFYQGVKSYEARCRFQKVIKLHGEFAIQVSFPERMRFYRKRRHFRARNSEEVAVKMGIAWKGQKPIPVHVVDVSVGGACFCNPLGSEGLPVNKRILVALATLDLPQLVLKAMVRNHNRAMKKDGCPKAARALCGIQFDLMNEDQARDIEEITAYVQREFLAVVQEKKKGPPKKLKSRNALDEDHPIADWFAHVAEELALYLGLKEKKKKKNGGKKK